MESLRVLKILLFTAGVQLATMAVLLVRTKGLALLLGPELFGVMAALDRLIAIFVQTASLSLPYAALQYLSPLWHEDKTAFYSLFRKMRNVLLVLIGLAMIVAELVIVFAPQFLGNAATANPFLASLAILCVPVLALGPFMQNAIAATFDHNRTMLFAALHAVVFTATGMVGVLLHGLSGLYILYAAAGGCLMLAALLQFERLGRSVVRLEQVRSCDSTYLPAPIWRFGLLLLAQSFLAPSVAYWVFDRVIAAHGHSVAGYMQAAMGISLAVRGVLGAGQFFLYPQVTRRGDFHERLERANNFQKTMFLLVGVVVPPLLLFVDVIVPILYSAKFMPASSFVVIFVGIEVLGLAVGNYQPLLMAMGHIGASVLQNAVAQGAMFGVATLLIPKFGIVGAGLGALTATVVQLVWTTGFLGVRYGFKPRPRIALLLVYVLLVIIASGLAARLFPGLGPTEVLIKLGLYFSFSALLAVFLDGKDWANLRNHARALVASPPSSRLRQRDDRDCPPC
jgi:O-antigen/teichoic acid export membrane protein